MSNLVINLPSVVAEIPPEVLAAIDAGILVVEMDCTSSEQVGDLVRLHATTANLVERTTDNLVGRPVIGWIKEKLSAVLCRVATKGIIDVSMPTGRVYLGTDGLFASAAPDTGYIQALGYSFGNGKLNLDPELKLTLKA